MRVRILRTTSSHSCCNCCFGRNRSRCSPRARPPPLTRATASSFALDIYPLRGAAAATVPGPYAVSSLRTAALPVIPAAPQLTAPPCSEPALHFRTSVHPSSRGTHLPRSCRVEDDREETRVTLLGGVGPLTRGCVL